MRKMRNLSEMAARFEANRQAATFEYSEDTRAQWLTLHSLRETYAALGLSAAALLRCSQNTALELLPNFQSLWDDTAVYVEECERLVADIDTARVSIDPFYAGAQYRQAEFARQLAQNATPVSKALDTLCIAIEASRSAAPKIRAGFASSGPELGYAVAQENFTHAGGGTAVGFHRGIRYEVLNADEQGIRVHGGSYAVYFTHEQAAQHFVIVKE